MLEMILLIVVVGTLNIMCFFIGAKVGQKVVKGEAIKTPTLSPIALYNEHQSRKEAEKELDKLDVIMKNLENYDGTGANQEDVPR